MRQVFLFIVEVLRLEDIIPEFIPTDIIPTDIVSEYSSFYYIINSDELENNTPATSLSEDPEEVVESDKLENNTPATSLSEDPEEVVESNNDPDDPDYHSPRDATTDSQPEHTDSRLKRKIDAKKAKKKIDMKREHNKKLRRQGLPYNSYKKHDDGKYRLVPRPPKIFLPFCKKHPTTHDKTKHCNNFTEEECQEIRKSIQDCDNNEISKALVLSLMTSTETKRKTIQPKQNRTKTIHYHLKKDGKLVQVCKSMFMAVFCLTPEKIRWYSQKLQTEEITENAKNKKRHLLGRRLKTNTDDDKKFLNEFFKSVPKVPAHYSRKRTNKLYFDIQIKTIHELYELYINECKIHDLNPYSYTVFREFLKDSNYSLFKTKKDRCNLCMEFDAGNIKTPEALQAFEEHKNSKNRSRAEKEKDKNDENEGTTVITTDTQALLISPDNDSNSMFYRTKLNIHNLSYHDAKTKEGYNYLWNECDSGLDANYFTSIHIHHLEEVIKKKPNLQVLIIWSDGCTYQNKNFVYSSALSELSKKHKIVIIQKFLTVGHTFMEVDSIHSKIERKLNKTSINIPADYVEIIKRARRNPAPYHATALKYDFFKNYESIAKVRSIRPGIKSRDPTVNNLQQIKYKPNGEIYLRLKHDGDWMLNPCRLKNIEDTELQGLHTSRIAIKYSKFKHLQELKRTIHEDYHHFYDNLPHEPPLEKKSNQKSESNEVQAQNTDKQELSQNSITSQSKTDTIPTKEVEPKEPPNKKNNVKETEVSKVVTKKKVKQNKNTSRRQRNEDAMPTKKVPPPENKSHQKSKSHEVQAQNTDEEDESQNTITSQSKTDKITTKEVEPKEPPNKKKNVKETEVVTKKKVKQNKNTNKKQRKEDSMPTKKAVIVPKNTAKNKRVQKRSNNNTSETIELQVKRKKK